MKFSEFVDTYYGQAIDYDGGFGVQCVDLIKLYLDKCFGIIPRAIGNAESYWNKFHQVDYLYENFIQIPNTPEFIPQKGDICCWTEKLSAYGHVSIATGEGNTHLFDSYDQNWNGKEMHVVTHNYLEFEGVLRPKNQSIFEDDGEEIFVEMKEYRNGSTPETVFSDTGLSVVIGSLNPYETCDCLGVIDNRPIVLYNVDGTNEKKIGFVEWTGGVK